MLFNKQNRGDVIVCKACKKEFEYDVVVCGGGPSGIMAAAAAAQNGAKTALIERYAFMGGLATAGLVAPISEFRKNGRRIIGGLPWQFVEKLAEMNGADLSYPNGNTPFDSEVYKLCAQRFLQEKGVTVFLNTTLIGCETEKQKIVAVKCQHFTGEFTLRGKTFVDATGDAMLCFYAGVPFLQQETEKVQPASLCLKLGNVDTAHLEKTRFREHNTKYSNQRVREMFETIKEKGEEVPQFGGPWFHIDVREGVVYVNMTRSAVNLEDPIQCSQMECRLRENAFRLVELLKENIEEFKDCYIIATGTQAGYRETRRVRGVHILTGEEILQKVHFEDTIAKSAHPIDIHCAKGTKQNVAFLQEEGCIPFRSLYTDAFTNLLIAGRCISADENAFASVRVQAPVMAIGQAAGTAAALCAKNDLFVGELSFENLKSVLLEQGAVL